MDTLIRIFTSKGVLGGIVGFVAIVLTLFGYNFGATDQAKLVEALILISGAVGTIVGVIGRLVAKDKILPGDIAPGPPLED